MIRFRNPSSNLDTILSSFRRLYVALKDKDFFNNDDIAQVLVQANLMASSGFIGKEAIKRGANTDKSRDKTYNNAKMFAEIYRLLGLISIIDNVSSHYRFTYIGDHMAVSDSNMKLLVEQCVLGINNPNEIMNVSYNENVRFFACVLHAMEKLGGYMCRDEIILGPMCVNDIDETEFSKMINLIKDIRGKPNILQEKLISLAKSLSGNKKEGVTITSIQNCTRFPISVLKYCNWVESVNMNIYNNRTSLFFKLTNHGKEVLNFLKNAKDIRLSDYKKYSSSQKAALIRLGIYNILGKANFDISQMQENISIDKKVCHDILNGRELLFSPYQTLKYDTVNDALNILTNLSKSTPITTSKNTPIININETQLPAQMILIDKENVQNTVPETTNVVEYRDHVKHLYDKCKNISQVVDCLMLEHLKDKKTKFYPLIETLFRIIGVNCQKSRDGVNGERWDAMILDSKESIPIEIKSPTEELHISIKAIRQALENKIILLSRQTYITSYECSTYAVGYYLPNNRAEVSELIKDIKGTYGYKVAVFDVESLFKITVHIIIYGRGIDLKKLYGLEGIVNVKDIEN